MKPRPATTNGFWNERRPSNISNIRVGRLQDLASRIEQLGGNHQTRATLRESDIESDVGGGNRRSNARGFQRTSRSLRTMSLVRHFGAAMLLELAMMPFDCSSWILERRFSRTGQSVWKSHTPDQTQS